MQVTSYGSSPSMDSQGNRQIEANFMSKNDMAKSGAFLPDNIPPHTQSWVAARIT